MRSIAANGKPNTLVIGADANLRLERVIGPIVGAHDGPTLLLDVPIPTAHGFANRYRRALIEADDAEVLRARMIGTPLVWVRGGARKLPRTLRRFQAGTPLLLVANAPSSTLYTLWTAHIRPWHYVLGADALRDALPFLGQTDRVARLTPDGAAVAWSDGSGSLHPLSRVS